MNILSSLEKLSQTNNPFKIAQIVIDEYASLADELNLLSDEMVLKFNTSGYTGGLLYSLGMKYTKPQTFYQEAEVLLASSKALNKKEFLVKKLPPKFVKGVFGRYQGEISEEIDKKIEEELVVYQEIKELKKEISLRWKIQKNSEEVIKMEQRLAILEQKFSTGIDSARYRSQSHFYQSLWSVFSLLQHIKKMTFLFFIEPFLIDKIAENLSPNTLKNMVPIEYLFKFHFSRTYSEYVFMHNFFLHLKEASHPFFRYKKYTGVFGLFFVLTIFLPLGFFVCGVLFLLSYKLSFFKGEYNIPLTGISGILIFVVLSLSVTTFNGDFYQRFYARHKEVINHLMVWTPCDYIEKNIISVSLKSSVIENQEILTPWEVFGPECLATNYFLGEKCVK